MAALDPKTSTGEPGNSGHGERSPVHPDLLEILVCPMAHAELKVEDGHLLCTRCGPRFVIEDGIPIMLIEEAKLPPGIARIEDLPCYPEVARREKAESGNG
jgi:uncharacterized protein YbaR (Trm112 family)